MCENRVCPCLDGTHPDCWTFRNSCLSGPNALLVCYPFIQMPTLFTLQDFDTLLMHVLTAESFHISN